MPPWSSTSPYAAQSLLILPIGLGLRPCCSSRCGSGFCFPLQLFAQENKLSYMMIRVPRASKKDHESLLSFRFAFGGISRHPILGLLLSYSRYDHGNSLIERIHYFCFGRLFRFRKLPVAIA